jgi:predicted HTH transcriptional regulator
MSAAPRVVKIEPLPVAEFIERLSACVHELVRAEGGSIPYTIIREVAENFIHADFAEPVVSILERGSIIRFADQGPGMRDKERVLLPGFTTARGGMKTYIRGVGSGLPIVREYLSSSGGSIAIEDNLGAGSVVTVFAGKRADFVESQATSPASSLPYAPAPSGAAHQEDLLTFSSPVISQVHLRPRLTARQKLVLALVMESGIAGPSLIAKELGVGVSTAYRDLALLEEAGLIESDGGKRTLSPEGLSYLGDLTDRP